MADDPRPWLSAAPAEPGDLAHAAPVPDPAPPAAPPVPPPVVPAPRPITVPVLRAPPVAPASPIPPAEVPTPRSAAARAETSHYALPPLQDLQASPYREEPRPAPPAVPPPRHQVPPPHRPQPPPPVDDMTQPIPAVRVPEPRPGRRRRRRDDSRPAPAGRTAPPGPQLRPPPGRPAAPLPAIAVPDDGPRVGRVPAGDTLPVRAGRALVELVTTTVSTRQLTELVTAVQAPVTTGRRIAVASVCGGAGRTTVTALLGGVFAARRADHVLVADGDPETAALAWRIGLAPEPDPARTAAALLGVRGGTLADVDALLPATPAGLRLLTGPRPGESPRVAQVAEALSRFFAIGVLDCPRGLDAAADAGQGAHARVLVCPLTPAGLRTTAAALDRPGAPRPDVVALVALDPTGRAAVGGGAARVLDRLGVPVVVLPHDRHLAAGAPIDLARLGRATVLAATRLAGTALARAGR